MYMYLFIDNHTPLPYVHMYLHYNDYKNDAVALKLIHRKSIHWFHKKQV